MKWWGWILLILGFIGLCWFLGRIIDFRNVVIRKREDIRKAQSNVRIAKAKYLQVLRKTGTASNEADSSQGNAYKTANSSFQGGRFIGGAVGNISSHFASAGDFVLSLANAYQEAQLKLNGLVNDYNQYINEFPNVLLKLIFRFKNAKYIDSQNLDSSTKLSGFDDNDI